MNFKCFFGGDQFFVMVFCIIVFFCFLRLKLAFLSAENCSNHTTNRCGGKFFVGPAGFAEI